MKRSQLLRITLGAFIAWLTKEMQPAGKAALHALEARAHILIDALPTDDPAPLLVSMDGLDAASVEAGLDWLLTTLRIAYPDEWATIAVESLRLLLHKNIADVAALTQPPVEALTSQ